MDIHGIGPAGAARILADVGDVARFPDRNHFASWTGTAPIDASSGQHLRHRLSRAGNRRLNHVLYIAGIVQLRNDTAGSGLLPAQTCGRENLDGSNALPAAAPVRRGLRQLAADAAAPRPQQQSPGGHPGASLTSSAAGLPRTPALRISHFPDPHTRRYRHHRPALTTPVAPQLPPPGGAPEVSTWSAPPDERR